MKDKIIRLLLWFVRQYDKVPTSPGLLMPGNWYVVYRDGGRSKGMTYDAANHYAEIFNGKVFHTKTEEYKKENNHA